MRPRVVARSVEGTRQIRGWKLFMLVPRIFVAPPAEEVADWKTGLDVLQVVSGSVW